MGIGLDSCLIPLRHNLFLLQSTDFFYPLVDDPFVMGKITCANVLSDLYATGVTNIDNLSVIISICENMTDQERNAVMPLLLKGFQQTANSIGLQAIVNNAVYNPWCIIGGTATAVCLEGEYINPLQAEIGDVLILTKPLGAQMASNALRWSENPERLKKLNEAVTLNEIKRAYDLAVLSMTRLNKNAAELMHKYKAHAATDITGFGILGHAKNFASYQNANVKFVIHTLPVIKNSLRIAEVTGNKQKFLCGCSPETSGGLLICMNRSVANDFCQEIRELDGWSSHIIGTVDSGEKSAVIMPNPTIIEVEYER